MDKENYPVVTDDVPVKRRGSKGSREEVDLIEDEKLGQLGYKAELRRNRSLFTLLFQTLAIAAIPFGEGGPFINAIYGGGPLAIFIGWVIVLFLAECVAVSIAELASVFPTSAGPYYWSFQLAKTNKALLSFITGWIWVIGNWTITLSVNFGFASLVAAAVSIYHPDYEMSPWQVLLVFYAICLATFVICVFANRFLPLVDTICAGWTLLTIIIVCISLSVVANDGRHSASYALGHFDNTISGWGNFGFFIGILPPAYTFSACGMISSMAEEVFDPTIKVPQAISLLVPVGGIAGFFFILPICFTLPPLEAIVNAPQAQALPFIFHRVMGTPGGGLALTFLVLVVIVFCSISITVAASRTTWAFARDDAIPLAKVWSKVSDRYDVPVYAMALCTVIQMLLGLIYLGSSSAFYAFVSVGVIGLAVSYAIPIAISLFSGREAVSRARFKCGPVLGKIINSVAITWITFELILFSMPYTLPTTPVLMNYASVVFVAFLVISAVWYFVHARTYYKGPPISDGL